MTTTIETRTAPEADALPRASSRRPTRSFAPTGRRNGPGRAVTRPTLEMQRRLIAQLVG